MLYGMIPCGHGNRSHARHTEKVEEAWLTASPRSAPSVTIWVRSRAVPTPPIVTCAQTTIRDPVRKPALAGRQTSSQIVRAICASRTCLVWSLTAMRQRKNLPSLMPNFLACRRLLGRKMLCKAMKQRLFVRLSPCLRLAMLRHSLFARHFLRNCAAWESPPRKRLKFGASLPAEKPKRRLARDIVANPKRAAAKTLR